MVPALNLLIFSHFGICLHLSEAGCQAHSCLEELVDGPYKVPLFDFAQISVFSTAFFSELQLNFLDVGSIQLETCRLVVQHLPHLLVNYPRTFCKVAVECLVFCYAFLFTCLTSEFTFIIVLVGYNLPAHRTFNAGSHQNLFSGNFADDAFLGVVVDVGDIGNIVGRCIGGVVGDAVVAE